MFGKEIKLSFRTKESSQTLVGALFSFAMIFLILYYLTLQLLGVVYKDYELDRTIQILDIIDEHDVYKLTPDNFNFAVAIQSKNRELREN